MAKLASIRSIVEPEAHLDKDLPGIVPMETSKRGAVIEFDPPVGDVDCIQRSGDAFAEVLAERQIEGGVSGKIAAGIRRIRERIAEPRTIVNVGGSVGAPRQRDVGPEVQSVALVMVKRAQAGVGIAEIRGAIRQASGNGAAAVGNLIRAS